MPDIYKRITDTVTAFATVVLAATLYYVAKTYTAEEKAAQLQRTQTLITELERAANQPDQKKMLEFYSDRYPMSGNVTTPLPYDRAVQLYEIAHKPKDPDYDKWDIARRYLNVHEALAFAYIHNIADRKILASFACASMSQGYQYFRTLIDVFGQRLGSQQSWQIIGPVVHDMERAYGPECKQLHEGPTELASQLDFAGTSFVQGSSVPIIISLGSLGVALYALWTVHFRRGRLQMTHPTMVFLGRDPGPNFPKLWLRTLLFSTATRGQIVETMFVHIHAPVGGSYSFDFWTFGERGNQSRGSGLFVGQTGVVQDHHFVLRQKAEEFLFWPGDYRIEVFASVLGKLRPVKLIEITLPIDGSQSSELVQIPTTGLFGDWDAEAAGYTTHIERRNT